MGKPSAFRCQGINERLLIEENYAQHVKDATEKKKKMLTNIKKKIESSL